MNRFKIVVFYSCLFFSAAAQDIVYAKKIIDTLASDAMRGRGYTFNGDKIAAEYLRSEFIKHQLLPFNQNYFQPFTLSANTFSTSMEMKVDGIALIPGKDFIVDGASAGAKKTYGIVDNKIKTQPKNAAYIIHKELPIAPACDKCLFVFTEKDKLTKSVSTVVKKNPVVHVMSDKLPAEAKEIELTIKNKFIKKYTTQNVIGYFNGTQFPDSFIVFTAHYDHLGTMGKTVFFPGANDNASGCAMLLNLVNFYQKNPPAYSVAFMLFSAEEMGLLGSKYYVEHPLFALTKIKMLINLDLMGNGNEGIAVVNGSIFTNEYNKLIVINDDKNYVSQIKARGKAANSDHYYFTEAGVKSFFIYTLGGSKAYHDIDDTPDKLSLTNFKNVFQLLVDFSNSFSVK